MTTVVRLAALAIGLIYLLLGVLGFTVAEHPGQIGPGAENTVWIFSVSSVQNVLHVAVGLLGLAAATRAAGARIYGIGLFVVFIGMTAFGVLASSADTPGNVLNLNWAANWLHGLTALAGLAMWLSSRRTPERT
ncbi:DUF4383 domain-containing protein [Amycolatopsis sp. 195334CR]|uniref:DUF4383 domain-containing protein n=1 Tax=Amycolatopsis sp. 195334CR TaxID=2814588 RepID=UPI001A901177|nr:DUF4383 domain-containing protein [Amycolatopsis sp. 195334CR]MBN6041911.1 DUF4383 domain-containing protein [Amycolatopsis sp. 195334CR]